MELFEKRQKVKMEKPARPQPAKRTGIFYMKDPTKNRENEQVGGGFFVFRRGEKTNRIRPAWFPFEHPNYESAKAELDRLQKKQPDEKFVIFSEVK